jgi:hypothetical protein
MKPVAIDLCCGLGGWTQGLLAEGWDVVGFDIERHEYGNKRYPAHLILKSILEINGYDLRAVNPSLVVASPPCQEYSYMAMPWSRAKQIAGALRAEVPFPEGYTGSLTVAELTALFDACFRIAREIGCPIVLENVKGAQPWVGRANAHYGSYYLWGDVGNVGGRVVRADRPAKFGEYVRPRSSAKKPGQDWNRFTETGEVSPHWRMSSQCICPSACDCQNPEPDGDGVALVSNGCPVHNIRPEIVPECPAQTHRNGAWRDADAQKIVGYSDPRRNGGRGVHLTSQRENDGGVKQAGHSGRAWFADPDVAVHFSSKSDSRKAASAMIAEIPFPLAQHVARVFRPS